MGGDGGWRGGGERVRREGRRGGRTAQYYQCVNICERGGLRSGFKVREDGRWC